MSGSGIGGFFPGKEAWAEWSEDLTSPDGESTPSGSSSSPGTTPPPLPSTSSSDDHYKVAFFATLGLLALLFAVVVGFWCGNNSTSYQYFLPISQCDFL